MPRLPPIRLRRGKKNSVAPVEPPGPFAPPQAVPPVPARLAQVEVVCRGAPFVDILPTGALLLLLHFAERIGFLDLLRRSVAVPVKAVDYTPWDKLVTLICSLAVGCDHTKDVNHKLRPYPLAARFLGMERFPDQSTLNRFLHRLGPDQRRQLDALMESLLRRFGLWRGLARVPVDIDSTGLMVYGRTYEFARKGYFPRQRGRRGYRLTLASTYGEAGPEILALFLDPANASAAGRLWDCLYQSAEVAGSVERLGLIRADAAFGSGPDVQELIELGLPFIVKGFSDQTARKFARQVEPTQWEPLDLFTRVAELGPRNISKCRHPVRVVLVELMTRRHDKRAYSHLYTSLSDDQADAEAVFQSYNQRQCIEALIKSAKYGLSIHHLRTRSYVPIENFLLLAAITFNLLAWFRHYLLGQVDLDDLGLRDLTHKLMDIPAQTTLQGNQLELRFPENHPLTPALCRL